MFKILMAFTVFFHSFFLIILQVSLKNMRYKSNDEL